MGRGEMVALALLLGAYLVLAAAYGLATPDLEAPDAGAHFRYVAFLHDHPQLPAYDLPTALAETRPQDWFATAAERSMTLEEVERSYVQHVLDRYGGNKKRAADALGINRRTIQRWLGEPASDEVPAEEPLGRAHAELPPLGPPR